MTDNAFFDLASPDETGLPPSARTWARLVTIHGLPALELRDPNSGQDPDPESKPRHQYIVQRDRLWSRRLPPARLDQPGDDSRWLDEPSAPAARTASAWGLVEPGAGLPWQWAELAPYATRPVRVVGEWDLHGDGNCATVGYEMPARNPWNIWADVTGAPCPHPGCAQTLVWYEAGYVPGYRVCMRRTSDDGYDRDTLCHRWLWWRGILVLES